MAYPCTTRSGQKATGRGLPCRRRYRSTNSVTPGKTVERRTMLWPLCRCGRSASRQRVTTSRRGLWNSSIGVPMVTTRMSANATQAGSAEKLNRPEDSASASNGSAPTSLKGIFPAASVSIAAWLVSWMSVRSPFCAMTIASGAPTWPAPPTTQTSYRGASLTWSSYRGRRATQDRQAPRLARCAVLQKLRGNTGVDRVRGHLGITCHHGARADDRALANGDTGQQHGVDADVRTVPDAHRLDDEVGLDDRHIDWLARVLASEHLRARPPPHVVAKRQIAAVEVRLRSDPGVRPDHAAPVVTALQERLVPDEHAVADLERLRMQHEHSQADADAVAELLAERTQEDAAALLSLIALERPGDGEALKQLRRRELRAQLGRTLDLVGRIGRDLFQGVDGLDDPLACHFFMKALTSP